MNVSEPGVNASMRRISRLIDECRRELRPLLAEPGIADLALAEALSSGETRVSGLWTLLLLPEAFRRRCIARLFDQSSVAHADVGLARMVLLSIDRCWLREALVEPFEALLSQESSTEDEFRRCAEIALQVGEPLISIVASKASGSADPEIREVADDVLRGSMRGCSRASETTSRTTSSCCWNSRAMGDSRRSKPRTPWHSSEGFFADATSPVVSASGSSLSSNDSGAKGCQGSRVGLGTSRG